VKKARVNGNTVVMTPQRNESRPDPGDVGDPKRSEGSRSEPERSAGAPTSRPASQPGDAPVPDPEVVPKAGRRHYTAEFKLRVLREADACSKPGEIGALLRREGLYSSLLTTWRRERERGGLNALAPKKRGRRANDPRDAEIERLRRENEKLQDRLRKAELIIDVQKKVAQMLGAPPTKPEDEGNPS
jgi:transposase